MSGICAVLRQNNPGSATRTLALMSGGLSLPGPEQFEQKTAQNAGVGVSSRFATQQVYEGPSVLIACDAKLYNEDELARLVETKEAPANARTAALLAGLYERFGCDFLEKLRGSFSLVLWNQRERTMLAAIDGFGVNRLVYYQDANVLLVTTRIDALVQSGEVDVNVNPRAIANVLNYSANLGPETTLTNIYRLPPGTFLLASPGRTRVQKYWDLRYGVGDDFNEARLSQKLESVVEQSVATYCKNESFAELGAFLSGGTDSSTVVGMMSRTGRGAVKTFSIGFEEQSFNELEYARITAEHFHADHHTYLVGPKDCFEALPDMVQAFDEPFGNSSAIPTYFCARLASQNGVKTLLGGDGGDELFGGNEWYRTEQVLEVYQAIPRVLRKRLIEPALGWLPIRNGIVGSARSYVRRSNIPREQRFLSYQFLCTHPLTDVFNTDFLAELGGYSVVAIPSRHYLEAPARDHLDRVLYTDLKITLGDNDLPKVTCMSEMAGIQARFPLLDRSVAEFSGRIPARLKVKGFEKRYLFKQAFRGLLPAEVLSKKKHGFGIPVATWLKSDRRMRELSRDTLLSSRAFERGYFRRKFIEDLFQKHDSDESSYYGDTLWTFLTLELWHRRMVDEPARTAV